MNHNYSIAVRQSIECISSFYYLCDFSVDKVAEAAHLSSGRISVLFKQETGNTIMNYLAEVRIKNAFNLLTHTNLKICEIAQAIGYQSSQYFSQVFFKMTGKTPIEFRKQQRGKDSVQT